MQNDRIRALRRLLAEHEAQLAVVPGNDFRYLMGWSPLPDERLAVLWLTREHSVLLINGVNAEEAKAKLGPEVEVLRFDDADDPGLAVQRAIQHLGPSAKAVHLSDDARFDHSQILRDALSANTVWGLASRYLAPMRMAKDPEEIEALARSQAINDAVMRRAFAALRPGIREIELADMIKRAFVEEGADRDAFVIVAYGAHAAHPHHAPDRTPLTEGPVLLDIGCFKDGYASDMTRMAYVGEPSSRYLDIHALVEAASRRGIAAVHPGAQVGEVDKASRRVIEAAGLGAHFVHRTGHGIGLEVHERPSVTAENQEPMRVGMAFSIEPGIYLPNQFGVRLEEVVIVEEDGARVLSEISREVYVALPS